MILGIFYGLVVVACIFVFSVFASLIKAGIRGENASRRDKG